MIDPNNKIIYVSGDGSGDFNVIESMKYSAHTIINNAIKYVKSHPTYTTVKLKGPFTYWVNGTINCCSNLELTGDKTTCIKLVDGAGWKTMVPLIGPSNESVNNVSIHGFEIDGNHDGNYVDSRGKAQIYPCVNKGAGYYNHMYFMYSTNIFVYDMYLHDGHGDGLRVANCENVKFYNNTVIKLGHEAAFFLRSHNCHSYNNTVSIRTNTATRMNDCTGSSIHDNNVWAFADHWSAGNPGFQIEQQYKSAIDVEIYNNDIHDTYGCGIWLIRGGSSVPENGKSKVYIHHNKIHGCGINPNIYYVGGIINFGIHNVIVENNVIDKCYGHGVACMSTTDINEASPAIAMYVRNNIITNTVKRKYSPTGSGYGIHNRVASSHKMYVNNNCVYNNISGEYNKVSVTNDINVDPLYGNADTYDYHLKSTGGRWECPNWVIDDVHSPCIDAGWVESKYTDEPDQNGGVINIGMYGGTRYASKSKPRIVEDPVVIEDPVIIDDPVITPPVEVDEPIITTVTLYPIYSNRLKQSDATTALKTHTYTDTGALGVNAYRDLLYFDFSQFDNTQIYKAELYLCWYYPEKSIRANDTIVEIYRPQSYTAAYASWVYRNKDVKWDTPGSVWYDLNGTVRGSVPFASATFDKRKIPDNAYHVFDVTELLKKYADNTNLNTGILIKAKNENDNYIAFYSGNMLATNKKPKLVVTYGG